MRGVVANKLRSVLTMSGILIGVAAVIILIAAGNGASAAITELDQRAGEQHAHRHSRGRRGSRAAAAAAVAEAGRPAAASPGLPGGGAEARRPAGTRHPDRAPAADPRPTRRRCRTRCRRPTSRSVAPVVNATSVTATYDGRLPRGRHLQRHDPELPGERQRHGRRRGAVHRQSDYDQRSRVALVGLTVATSLVGGDGTAIVGQTVQFNGDRLRRGRAARREGQHRAAGPGRPASSPR